MAFLNCANALKPILPKSQVWCVDGDSKFVLQIRPPQYWRIEVPNKTADEILKVEELKRVFDEILLFEKTPCPFQRNFVVELPKIQTPVKKKPWKPVARPKIESPYPEEEERHSILRTPPRSSSYSPSWGSRTSTKSRSPSPLSALDEETRSVASKVDVGEQSIKRLAFTSIETIPALEDVVEEQAASQVSEELEPSLIEFGEYTGIDDSNDKFSESLEDNVYPSQDEYQPVVEKETRPQALQNLSRSITAPPVLSLITSPPSGHRTRSPSPLHGRNVESRSDFSSSVESFHSVQSWHSPLAPPSPPASAPTSPTSTYPYPHQEIIIHKRSAHSREASDITISPETTRTWDRIAAISEAEVRPINASSSPKTPPTSTVDESEKSEEEPSEVLTPPTVRPTIRHRATTSSNSRRRALSPLPPAVNLFSPSRRRRNQPGRLQTARHLPTAIIQKTYEILLSPPSHLFHLMVSIASKIAAGEWRGVLSGHGEAVHWDFEDEYGGDGLFEDDYGISLPRPQAKARSSAREAGGSWEVD